MASGGNGLDLIPDSTVITTPYFAGYPRIAGSSRQQGSDGRQGAHG